MNRLLYVFLFSMLLSSCKPDKKQDKEQEQPPNIIFIMTDDHAYQALSAYDDRLISTPNLDELAEEGMIFNHAYVTNSISSPSRATILTGKHSHENGVINNSIPFDSTQQTYPKILQENGYETAVVGKWHLKSQPTGFDYWRVLDGLGGQGYYYHPIFRSPEGTVKKQGYTTDVITDMAIDWLKSGRSQDKPFMLMYQHKAPHREWLPSMRHLEFKKDENIPEPATLFDDYGGRGNAAKEAEMLISEHMSLTSDNKLRPEMVRDMGYEAFYGWYDRVYKEHYNRLTEEEQKKWDAVYGPINQEFKEKAPRGRELTRWKYQRYMEDYLACIKAVDENVGRLMKYLDESGLAENTLVIYTSDQGFYLGEHGWFDKRFMYEESFRTPLIVRWPGHVEPGSENDQLVQNLDYAETMLDAAGVEVPSDMQGKSMVPLLEGQNTDWRDALYYHYYEYPGIHAVKRHYGIRTDRYKLIHFYHDVDEWELYDLKKDPNEMHNVIDDPEYIDVKKELRHDLDSIMRHYGDSDSLRMEYMPGNG
ncbi:MAG: sulfatase [Bacteroidales bacterium]|nr:sulfatase [Bacteroidales bacterium]